MTTSKGTSNPITTEDLLEKHTAMEIAKALAGALVLLAKLECPDCGTTLEATVESTTKASREQSGRGIDQMER